MIVVVTSMFPIPVTFARPRNDAGRCKREEAEQKAELSDPPHIFHGIFPLVIVRELSQIYLPETSSIHANRRVHDSYTRLRCAHFDAACCTADCWMLRTRRMAARI
jgi:hypothetical protein